jgi:enoyl-CoA hydratase/carnithine racemase
MTYETLLIERRRHTVDVTLTRPEVLKALNTTLREDLKQFFTASPAYASTRKMLCA